MQTLKNILLGFYTAWAVIVFFIFALLAIPCYLWIALFERNNKARAYMRYNRFWSYAFGFFTGIRYDIHGLDKLKDGDPHVIVSNHSSIADMFIAANALRVDMRLLGKKELVRLPLLGYLFGKMLVFVDRSNAESRKKSVLALSQLIREKGLSVVIFPEGTRNRTDAPLKSFYNGAFRLAIECQVPIIPLIYTNVKQICNNDRFLFSPGTIGAYYGESIPTKGLGLGDMEMLKEKVKAIMEQMIITHDDAFKRLRGVASSAAGTPAPPAGQITPTAESNLT